MNKGFTLIELLAVLVLIAVLASITSLSIDSSVRKHRNRLSDIQINKIEKAAEAYYLKEGINSLDYNRDIIKTCVSTHYLIENDYIKDDEINNLKDSKKITGSVKIIYDSNEYTYEYQEKACSNKDMGIVCEGATKTTKTTGNIPQGNYLIGDEYICEVVEGTKYHFFILSVEEESINLIMDRNICDDGLPTAEGKTCLVAWNSSGYSDEGPVTAMTYLYNATKDWINVPALNYTYNDREFQGITEEGVGYTSFESIEGIATITALDGTTTTTIGSRTEPLKARMPIYTSNSTNLSKNEVAIFNNNNGYLYEYLDGSGWEYDESTKPENNISGIYGYWILSSRADNSHGAWRVCYGGHVDLGKVGDGSYIGVRPVINVDKRYISN